MNISRYRPIRNVVRRLVVLRGLNKQRMFWVVFQYKIDKTFRLTYSSSSLEFPLKFNNGKKTWIRISKNYKVAPPPPKKKFPFRCTASQLFMFMYPWNQMTLSQYFELFICIHDLLNICNYCHVFSPIKINLQNSAITEELMSNRPVESLSIGSNSQFVEYIVYIHYK